MITNIAHRGARSLAPENTLAAARKAYQAGADLWETDIAVTKDEALILFHDDFPGRTTNAATIFPGRSKHRFSDYTLAEFRQLDAGSFFAETDPFGTVLSGEVTDSDLQAYSGERVPTLAEALRLTTDLDWSINLELKALPEPMQHFPVVDRVLAEIDQADFDPQRLVISSFNHHWLRQIQALQPDVEVQALIGYSFTDPLDWGGYEFPVYNARSTLITPEAIHTARRQDVRVNLFTVNDPREMLEFIEAGVSGLITDSPQRLARILQDLQTAYKPKS